MKRWWITFTLVFVPLIAQSELPWTDKLEQDNVRIQVRPVPDSKHQEFKAVTEIDATVAQVLALLQDNSACTRWLFRCKESRVLKQLTQTERYFYQSLKLPFPAKSREVVFYATVSYNSDKAVTVLLESVPTASTDIQVPESGLVRVNHARGSYLLETLSESRVKITWQQFVDPEGALPAWLVNSMLTDLPLKSLISLSELVHEPPWRDASFVYDDQGLPIDINY